MTDISHIDRVSRETSVKMWKPYFPHPNNIVSIPVSIFLFKFYITAEKIILISTFQSGYCSLGCPKYMKMYFFAHILHVASFIPKKIAHKKIKSFQTFVFHSQLFSFFKGNHRNIQRKIWQPTVLALIYHRMV